MWTYFADAAPSLPLLRRLPVGIVGVDLAETDPTSLSEGVGGRGIGLGCLDPRTTLREDPGEVAEIARSLADRLRPPVLWLGPGGPLDLLPPGPAVRQLEVLPEARRRLGGGEPSR